MRYCLLIVLFTLAYCMTGSCDKPNQDDDFAEFEDDDFVSVTEEKIPASVKQQKQFNVGRDQDADDDGMVVEDDKEEFEQFDDDEEFEG